jgi:hypothetical protein
MAEVGGRVGFAGRWFGGGACPKAASGTSQPPLTKPPLKPAVRGSTPPNPEQISLLRSSLFREILVKLNRIEEDVETNNH